MLNASTEIWISVTVEHFNYCQCCPSIFVACALYTFTKGKW